VIVKGNKAIIGRPKDRIADFLSWLRAQWMIMSWPAIWLN
jgi:hypothetical protein